VTQGDERPASALGELDLTSLREDGPAGPVVHPVLCCAVEERRSARFRARAKKSTPCVQTDYASVKVTLTLLRMALEYGQMAWAWVISS